MELSVVRVTPQLARQWLQHNIGNRNIRQSLVRKYAVDMRNGAWHLTHQGISFYDDNLLADGQHRLEAVCLARVAVDFVVCRGLPRESAKGIDLHAARQAHDALRIGGGPEWISKEAVAIIRILSGGVSQYGSKSLSIDSIEAFGIEYEEAIKFGLRLTSNHKKSLTQAPIAACYAMAFLAGENRKSVERFAEIMLTGEISTQEENAAVRLREYLLFNPMAWHGPTARVASMKRAQRAIHAFCRGQSLSKLYEPSEIIYPFPGFSSKSNVAGEEVRSNTRKGGGWSEEARI